MLITRLLNQRGSDGLPDAAEYKPAQVSEASSALNRIHAISSSTKAGSFIWAALPATKYSSTFSITAHSVSSITRTPLPVPACSGKRNSSTAPGD